MLQHSHTAQRRLSLSYLLALLVLLPLFAGGCYDSDGHGSSGSTGTRLTKITLDYTTVKLPVGLAAKVDAIGTYSDGTTSRITDRASWRMADETIASVTGGKVTALKVGSTTVTAYCDNLSATAKVIVNSDKVVDHEIDPENVTVKDGVAYMNVNETAPVRAIAVTSSGSVIDLTDVVSWNSSDTNVAEVKPVTANAAAKGLGVYIITHNPGKAIITASNEKGQVLCSLTVIVTDGKLVKLTMSSEAMTVPVGLQKSISVKGQYSDGTSSDVTALVTWSSSDEAVANIVFPANGDKSAPKVAGYTAGTATITASLDNLKTTCKVTVKDDAQITKIEFVETSPEVFVGDSDTLKVIATLADGSTVDVTDQVEFSSSNPKVATVESASTGGEAGKITGVEAGTATITATINGQTATVKVTVKAVTLTAITIDPETVSTPLGVAVTVKATGVYDNGTTKDITGSAEWTTSDAAVAVVEKGKITPKSVGGPIDVTASLDECSASCKVTVKDAVLKSIAIEPATISVFAGHDYENKLVAKGTFTDGETIELSEGLTWTTDKSSVATVSEDGTVSGVSAGKANIKVKSGNITSSACVVKVSAVKLKSITLEPDAVLLPNGESTTEALKAKGTYNDGTVAYLTDNLEWKSKDTSIAIVMDGVITGKTVNAETDVYVVCDKVTSSNCHVTVTDAKLKSITVTPSALSIAKGLTDTVHATGVYSDGTTKEISNLVTWTSTQETYAAVTEKTATGATVKGLAVGSSALTAAYDGVDSGDSKCTVEVTAAVPVSIAIQETTASAPAGLTAELSAKAVMSDESEPASTPALTWTSSDTSVATVDANGVVTGVKPGTATISATSGDLPCSQTCAVTITDAVLQSMTITPNSVTLSAKQGKNVKVEGKFSDGSTKTLTDADGLTWSTDKAEVATAINSVITAGETTGDTATITVKHTATELTATCAVTVNDATLDSITFEPASLTVVEDLTGTIKAIGHFSDGREDELTGVTFTSSNPAVATVDDNGTVTAVAEGTATIIAKWNGVTSDPGCAVEVTAPVLQSIALEPLELTLDVSGTGTVKATGTYNNNRTVDISKLADWTSSDTNIVRITAKADGGSTITARASGTANITASYDGISCDAPCVVKVTAKLKSITLDPAAPTMSVGLSTQMKAMGSYDDGSTSDITDRVTWSSADESVATVDQAGKVTAVAAGTVKITATADEISGEATVTVNGDTVKEITVTADGVTMNEGVAELPISGTATVQAMAVMEPSGSSVDITDTATVTSSNPDVVEIQGNKIVAKQAGTATITVTDASGKTGTLQVKVTEATLSSITLSSTKIEVAAGIEEAITVTGHYSDGTTSDVTALATWSSSDESIAKVITGSKAVGYKAGEATLTATYNEQTATCTIKVSEATVESLAFSGSIGDIVVGNTANLKVVATMSDGTTKDVTDQVTFTTNKDSVATVESATTGGTAGKVHGVAAGTATITASFQGQSATVDVTVKAVTLTSIALDQTKVTASVGAPVTLKATGSYDDGSTADVTNSAEWSSSDTNVAKVSQGKITPVAAGTATITAKVGDVTATCTVTVSAATLESIAIKSDVTPLEILVGQTATVNAVGTYSDGSTKTLSEGLTWSTDASAIASVSNGTITGVGAGTANIKVSYNGKTSETLSVTVSAAELLSLAIDPATVSLHKGEEATVKAYGTFTDESSRELTQGLTWSSSKSDVAKVVNGVITAVGEGSAEITVKSGEITSSVCKVTVSAATLDSITAEPTAVTVGSGLSETVKVYGEYSDGTRSDITSLVTWTSDASTVAVVSESSASGAVVKGVSAGSAKLTASYEGKSATVNVTVTAATVESIAIKEKTAETFVGQSVTLTAQSVMSDGSTSASTPTLTWKSSDPSVATVDDNGKVTGVKAGTATISAVSGDTACSQTCTVTIKDAVLTQLTVTPATVTLSLDQTKALTVKATFDADGIQTTKTLTEGLTWSTSAAAVAKVANGTVTAVSGGTATITVSYTSGDVQKSATCEVTVSADDVLSSIAIEPATLELTEGQTGTLKAMATFNAGQATERTEELTSGLTWNTSKASVASVLNGTVTAKSAGTANITVAYNDVTSSTCAVTVKEQPKLTSITLDPSTVTLSAGLSSQLKAMGSYTDGTSSDVTSRVTWTSSDEAIATVSAGKVTAVAVGTVTITAKAEDVTAEATVTVNGDTVKEITVTADGVTMSEGVAELPVSGAATLQATAVMEPSGSTVDITDTATITSSNPEVVEIQGNKIVAKQPGSATITVTDASGKTGTLQVTVTEATLNSITLSSTNIEVSIGIEEAITAIGHFSDGTTSDVTALVSWHSADESIANVVTSGSGSTASAKVVGYTAGDTNITATYNNKNATCAVKVSEATVESLSFSGSVGDIVVGNTATLKVVATMSDGTTKDVTDQVTFTTSKDSVATVESATTGGTAGKVRGVSAGTATITASLQGKTATVDVKVKAVTLTSITLDQTAVTTSVGA
ncbi:MAG: Ig-like domain-containing protein, partial [bacterium]|nr:Ig-like domain-containing protein [bacterium]